MDSRTAKSLSRALFGLGRGAAGLARAVVPASLRASMDQRLFYAIFQITRVQNDDMVSPEVRARRAARSDSARSASARPTQD